MLSLTVFLKKADGWCHLVSHFDEGSLIKPVHIIKAFWLSRARARPKVNAKLHIILYLSAVMADIELIKPKYTTGPDR